MTERLNDERPARMRPGAKRLMYALIALNVVVYGGYFVAMQALR